MVAYDFGIKQNILRMLTREGCRVTVVPATDVGGRRAGDEAGWRVFLERSGRSGAAGVRAVENVRKLQGKKPIFGICLGHQIFGLALGGKTYKLKFGHHGGNHPIMNHQTGKVEITSQNHDFTVDPDSLPATMLR